MKIVTVLWNVNQTLAETKRKRKSLHKLQAGIKNFINLLSSLIC